MVAASTVPGLDPSGEIPSLFRVRPNGGDILSTVADTVSPVLTGLLARCAAKIRMAGYRHGLDPGDLEDLTQEVRIRIWKALGTSERIEAVSASYVYQAAATAAIDLIRQRRRDERSEPISEMGEELPVADPLHAGDRADISDAVWAAVARLEANRRIVARMYLQGYSYAEIADMLGWSPSRARNLLYRGLGELREVLTRLKMTEGS